MEFYPQTLGKMHVQFSLKHIIRHFVSSTLITTVNLWWKKTRLIYDKEKENYLSEFKDGITFYDGFNAGKEFFFLHFFSMTFPLNLFQCNEMLQKNLTRDKNNQKSNTADRRKHNVHFGIYWSWLKHFSKYSIFWISWFRRMFYFNNHILFSFSIWNFIFKHNYVCFKYIYVYDISFPFCSTFIIALTPLINGRQI